MVSTGSGRDKVTAAGRGVLAGLVMLAGAGCAPDPSTARGTAERFLDAHYVAIDLREAVGWTTGVAREKVEQEIALTQGQAIDASTNKPRVHYRLLEEHPDGEQGMRYLYEGTIRLEGGADDFERRWLVTVRRGDDGWRVTNFQEFGD